MGLCATARRLALNLGVTNPYIGDFNFEWNTWDSAWGPLDLGPLGTLMKDGEQMYFEFRRQMYFEFRINFRRNNKIYTPIQLTSRGIH